MDITTVGKNVDLSHDVRKTGISRVKEKVDEVIIIPCPPFELQLSHWDNTQSPVYSKRLLCFTLHPAIDKKRIVDYLHIAIHYTVQQLPFLAGSIVSGARPWLRDLSPKGALRLIIKDLSDELSFSQLAKSNFSQDLLDAEQLCPFPKVGYIQEKLLDACALQATFVNGGLLLVFSVSHIVSDGRGQWDILKLFAGELRKAQSGELGFPLKAMNNLYRCNRTALVSGNGRLGAIENHPAYVSSKLFENAFTPSKISVVETNVRTFRISASAMSALKEKASVSSIDGKDWISTADALSAFILRSVIVARHRAGLLPAGSTPGIVQVVNCRNILSLPEPYYGNAFYFTKASVPLSELADSKKGLRTAARLIRARVLDVTKEKFEDIAAYAERTKLDTHTHLEYNEDEMILLSNQYKFDLSDYNFGPVFGDGYWQACCYPRQGQYAGCAFLLPRLPDGSCEFIVTERDETVNFLLKDEFFRHFVQ